MKFVRVSLKVIRIGVQAGGLSSFAITALSRGGLLGVLSFVIAVDDIPE